MCCPDNHQKLSLPKRAICKSKEKGIVNESKLVVADEMFVKTDIYIPGRF